ncbi:MAG: GGDEF domain-containing protein [Deltaproteobacteria bacterium]|nr:GGDEF domain-containing protein [Deltaproteobacteria bacterium]
MQNMTDYIINGILIVGAGLLCVSFYPIQSLIGQLPKGALRRRWNDLRALILFFIAGYVSFTYLYWLKNDDNFNLIVPAVFFLGAVLVLFVGTLALETATEIKQIATLQYENITDHLIGIYNRRYLDRKIAEELPRVSRYGLPLSMLLLDIDHFKDVNDHHGHQVGDQTLKSLGQLLFKKVRDTDIIARYGGEEIAILALHTPVSDAGDLAERLRQAVETSIMVPADEDEKRPAITITVSIGVTGYDQQVTDYHVLIEQADKALYKAKQGGRNRVIVFDSTL